MRQVFGPGALGRPRGIGWRGRWEGGSGCRIHVNPWLIHVNVWQKPLQYFKVVSLQLIQINGGKKKEKTKLSFGLLFCLSLLGWPTLTPRGCIFFCLPIKLSSNTGPSVTSNFCCGKTEPGKSHTLPTKGSRKTIFDLLQVKVICQGKRNIWGVMQKTFLLENKTNRSSQDALTCSSLLLVL